MSGLRAKVVLSVDAVQAKRSAERAAAEINRVMGGVGKREVNFNVNSKSFTQPLGRITGSANEFTKSLEASNARVIAFGASVGIINAISDAFKNLVGETVRFEKTLTDINVVLNQSNSAMQKFGQGLFDVARNTAQSFNVASAAALEFSRQGLTMEEVLKRTNDALTLTRLTGLKAAEAVSGLTAAVNAFSSVGLTTTQVIDKLAAVDVKFAVSSEDLINALERTGAVAIDAGVGLDSLIGLVTSLQQTTARGGAVIGNGLKTIFTRIQRPAALSQIEDLDIAVRNMSGAILPADKILINIAKSFDRLTSSQQSNIVQFSAGIFQANVFRASLRDLAKDQSIQARATEVSASAAGEAAMKNKQLNKTISALASQTGSDIQELATLLGELMVKPELGSYLETFRDVIGGIKNMLGGGEDEGSTFAKGLVAGIGNIITGPAFIAFGAIFIKLFMNIAKFAKGSMKDVMNIVDRKTKVEQIEKSIVETLSKNKNIQESLNNLEGDREAQSKFILKIIEAQTNAMREQEKLASRLARPLLDAGVKSDLTVSGNGRVDLDGDGRTDSFGAGGVVPQSARKERKEASRGGYSAGAVDSMSIKGLGRVVYNKAETVKQFPGMQQPAIMPPKQSRAGSAYKDAFSTKHGFDPYAAGGFIPNFAELYKTRNFSTADYSIFYKTPLDVVDRTLGTMGKMTPETEKNHGLRNRRSNQQRLLEAGHSPEQLFAEDYPITSHNIEDGILRGLLKGDVTALRARSGKFKNFVKSADTLNMRRYGGRKSTTEAWLKTAPPLATDLGNAYEIPSKAFEARLEGQTWPIGEFHHLAGLKPGKSYDSKKFISNINSVRDFKGMAEGLVNSGDTSDDWMGRSLGQQKGLLSMRGQGLIPNFATLSGDILRLNQSKMHLYANPREAKPGGDAVRNAMKALVDSGKPVTVSATTDKLLKGEGGSHTKAIKGLIRFIADQENGPKLFERDFKLTNLPWKGNKGEDASEDAVAKALNKGGNKYINTGKRPGAPGDKTFPVDLIGEGLDPVEVKSGEWQQPNILLKSMRLYSDDELIQFAERQYGATPEMLKGARMEKLGKSARLLQTKGLLDKNASSEEQHNAVIKYGIAGGFVPNYLNQTDQGKDEEWKSIAGWLKKQKGKTILRAQSLEEMKKAGVLVSTKSPKSMADRWSRLLGPPDKSENLSVQGTARRALGTEGYEELLKNAREILPVGQRAGAASTGPPSSLPQLVWGRGGNLTRKASLGDIMGKSGALSLNQLDGSGSSPGAAFRDTNFGEANFNNLASTWEGRGDLSALASTSYTAGITPWHPYRLNEDGTEGPPISQYDLKRAGIDDQNFEALIAKDPEFGTGTVSQAPLDFTGPNGEAKLVPGFATTSKNLQGTPGGFYWSQIIGKILRSNIGNSGLSSKTKAQDFKDMWSAPGTLSTNLFIPKLASGLIPNFADDRNRQQKISDVLGDPSNAGINFKGGALKPRSIKSKNMFQKTWLESYFKTGLEGDYQMLMKMGYDPDQLLDLRAYSKKGGDVNVLGKGLVPNFAAGFGGALAGASKTAVQFGLAKMPRKNDLFMGAANVPSKIAKVSSKKGELHTEEGQAVRLDQLVHQEYSNRIPGASNNLFSRTSSNPVGMFNTLNKSGKAMIRDGYLEGGLLKHAEGNGFRLQKMDGKWHYERMGTPTQADDRLMNDMEIMSGQSFNYGLQQSAPKSGGFIDWDSRRPGYLAEGLIPNFARTPNADFGSKVKSSQLDPARRMALEKPINVAAQNLLWKKGTPEDRKDLERLGYKGEKPWEFKWQDWDDKKSPIWEMLKMGSPQKGMSADNFKVLGAQFRYFQKQDQRMGVELNTPGDFFESYQSGRKFSELKHESANLNTRAADSVPAAFDRYRHRKEMAGVTDINGIPLPLPHGAQGMVPNFANPLKDAVSRERQAGIPESKIRVEKSNQLRGPGNPMGLAVTNTRDEPLGVGQGIRRARSMGIDPRKHGAASGVVPNFAAPGVLELPDGVFDAIIEDAEKLEKAMGEELTSAVGEATEALKAMGNTDVTPSEDRKKTATSKWIQSVKLKAEKDKDPADQDKDAIKNGESIIEHLNRILGAIKKKEGAVGETEKVRSAGQKITKSDANIEQINTVVSRIINKKIKEVGGTTDGKERKALVKITEELQNFKKTLEESEESIKDEKQERGEGLQKLFYMQSAISMTNGFLEQFAEGARGGTAALIGVAQAASNVTAAYMQQKELIGEGMNMLGVGEKEKGFSLVGGDSWAEQRAKGAATELTIRGKAEAGGKKGGILGGLGGQVGKLGRTFGRFLPIVGQLYTGFTMANEAVKFLTQTFPNFGEALGLEKGEGIMDLFSSSATKAAKKLERLGKTVESLETVLGHLENKEEEQIKLRELEVTGANRTQAQEKEYYDLRVKSIDTDAALAASMSSMMDETKSGSGALARINAVIGSTTMSMAEQRAGIRELIVANKMLIAATSQREGFQQGLDRASDGVNDSDTAIKLGEARGAQLALTLGSAFEGKADATDDEKVAALEHNIRELTRIRGNYKGIDGANFKTQDAIGSVGLQGMLSDQVVDIEDFENDMTWGLSDTEKKIFKAEVQTLIDGLQKRVNTQKSGLKDDVDMNILSRKKLKLALFNIEQEKKRAKHTSDINLENTLHATKSQGVENDILKEYEGISQSLQIRKKMELDGIDLQSKYQHDREEAERGAIDAIDKATQEKLTDPGSLMGPLNTSVGTHTKEQVQTALTEFDKRVGDPITLAQFNKAGETTTGITSDEKEAIRKSFVAAVREVKGMGDAYGKLQVLAEEGNKLETARLKAIYVSLISAKEIIKQEDAGAQKNQEINEANDLKLLVIKNQNELAKKDLAQASVGSLIAAKTVGGAKALHEKLIGNKNAQEISGQLAGVINDALQGEADTLAVINEYNEGRVKILLTGQALDKKAYQSQVEKNRTEMESGLLALRQLEYQNESLELSEESQMIQEIKLKTEIATAGQSAKEAELRYKFLSDLTNRSALIKEQIGAEMSGLRTAKMMNRDKLKQQIQGGELNEMVRIELEEQETSLSTEALKNAQLAANLSHLKESGSLTDMANRLQEKSNKLIEAQNAVRQASISRGDLAFNTRADLNTEEAGAVAGTKIAAMRSITTGSPEDAQAFASSLEATNKQINNGTRAIDRLRTRMTELDVSAANLGADLVELGFDGVRSGFKNLLEQIGTGAKSAGDAWKEFGLNLAKTLLDRITDHNIDRIVKDLSFAFTGVEVKSEAEKIASSNSHLMDHLSSLTTSNDSLKDGILSLERQLKEGIKLRPPAKDESTPPVIPDKTPTGIFSRSKSITPPALPAPLPPGLPTPPRPGAPAPGTVRGGPPTLPAALPPGLPPLPRPGAAMPAALTQRFLEQRVASAQGRVNKAEEIAGEFATAPAFWQDHLDEYGGVRDRTKVPEKKGINVTRKEVFKEALSKKKEDQAQLVIDRGIEKGRLDELHGKSWKPGGGEEARAKELEVKIKTLSDKLSESTSETEELTKKIVLLTEDENRSTKRLEEAAADLKAAAAALKEFNIKKNTPLTQQGGGIIQHFANGGYVKGPGGKDKVPAMLTAGEFVIPKKEVDNIQKFNDGTDKKGAEKKSTPGERLQSGVEGGLKMWAMSETAKAVAKAMDDDADKPPTFNMKKLDNLDLGSDVNIKRGDPRLSSKFLARDPVMQEYRDYLIESANYKAQKTNENFRENMSTFASVFSAVTSFVTAELMSYAAPLIQKGLGKATDFFKGDLGLGKHSDAYRDLKDRGFDPSYSDVSESLESGKDLVLHRNKGKSNESEYSFKPYSGKFRGDKSNENNTEFEFMPHRSQIHGRQRRAPTRPGAAAFDKHGVSNFNPSNPFDLQQSRGFATIKTQKSQGGGSIPAMLTAGEGYIPAPVAKRIGYNNLSHMNNTGSMPIVKGTGGVDNVGPVGLNSGDFIMKKSSTNKLLRDNPNAMRFSLQGQSEGRRGAQGYYEGGVVGSELTVPARSLGPQKSQQGNRLGLLDQKESEKSDSSTAGSTTNAETTNNININISIDKAGAEVESQEGGEDSYEKERNLSMKIKGAVLEVIREEKRIGGELS